MRGQRGAAVILCGCLAVAAFFRYQIADGFTHLFSDSYDGMLELALLDHWNNVLHGAAAWSEPFFFFPQKGALGYNDGYFIYGLIYSLFRAVHLDPLLSGELVNVVVRAIGFFGAYAAARRILDLPVAAALLAATIFTLSTGAYAQMDHAQMLTVGFAPLLAVPLQSAAQGLMAGDRRRLVGNGALFALGYAAWLMTAYYTAWFFFLITLAFSIAWLFFVPAETRRLLWAGLRREILPLVLLAGLFALAVLPFLLLYLPKAAETGQRNYAEVTSFLPLPIDIVNVGEGNLIWGKLFLAFCRLVGTPPPPWLTLAAGFPPITLLMFVAAAIWLVRSPGGDPRLRALMAAALVTWAMTLNIRGFSAYPAIYHLVPGAKAIRVVIRYQLMIGLPVIGLACAFLASRAGKLPMVLLAAAGIFMVADQFNHLAVRVIDRPKELARLGAVPPPPAACGAFFIERNDHEAFSKADAIYRHSVDAMLLSGFLRLPTVNGVDSFAPPGYDLYRPDEPSYRDRVRAYAERYGVAGLCGLDMRTDSWRLPDQTEGIPQ